MHQGTRDTYNQSAGSLSKHYDEIGPREGDVDLAFALAGNPKNAHVLEVGCGNGRDARAILKRTPFYTGIDIAEQMVARAKLKVPTGTFEVADAITYDYPDRYDIVFAFASIRHLSLDELSTVLNKVYKSLKRDGILYISSNYADTYKEGPRKDVYGLREMYFYNPTIIQRRLPTGLKKVHEIFDTVNGEPWFDVVFQKQV